MSTIQYQKGDIFDAQTQVIVNTVNCQGVMGKGLALSFKERYPTMFLAYQQDCETGRLRIGRPTLYRESTPWILNFPTKDHWRPPSKIEYLEKGLAYFIANYKKAGIQSISFPKLGVQNGKLSWDEVGPLMVKYLSQVDIDVHIYTAEGDREYQLEDVNQFETAPKTKPKPQTLVKEEPYPLQLHSSSQEHIWQIFSELALSQDRLCQEVGLSPKEARKIATRRATNIFSSFADIESLEGLAKISLQRIKKYIDSQQHVETTLPELTNTHSNSTKDKKKTTRPTRAKSKGNPTKAETSMDSLFSESLQELVG